ncbi:MAG TPA: glycosyltransferase family 4 protein [Candidatus Dormibacteraeota bacterium]|nr:glycosyltransferase family 4 protein [Candidatus Dormibacteraeota bacterium]
MRLAVYENLPPGGALRSSFHLGLELLERGHQIDLYRLSTYADKGSFDLAPHAGSVKVADYRPLAGILDTRLRRGRLFPRSYTLFGPLKRLHRRLAAEIRSGGYDAVLAHPDAMTYSPYLLRWLEGLPSVYYCQEAPRVQTEPAIRDAHRAELARSPRVVGGARLLEDRLVLDRLAAEDRENVRHPTAVAVNSAFSRERFTSYYGRDAEVCRLGVDPAAFAAAGPVKRRREVLSIGAPIDAKNHLLVIEALGRLPAASRPALRVVLPRPGGAERLETAAHAAGVELTVETGLDERALAERYRCALATICAARLEPFGLTAIESLAAGTPVVAVREGGFRETVVDGLDGFLVEPEAQALAAGIARIVLNPGVAEQLGEAGREEVSRNWTWKDSGDRLEAILEAAARR